MRVLGYAACRTAAEGVSDEHFLKGSKICGGSRTIIVVAGCTLHRELVGPRWGAVSPLLRIDWRRRSSRWRSVMRGLQRDRRS